MPPEPEDFKRTHDVLEIVLKPHSSTGFGLGCNIMSNYIGLWIAVLYYPFKMKNYLTVSSLLEKSCMCTNILRLANCI